MAGLLFPDYNDIVQERNTKDKLTAKTGKLHQASLLWTIARILGWPYLALGLIKLINDILNFAGPGINCPPHLPPLQGSCGQPPSFCHLLYEAFSISPKRLLTADLGRDQLLKKVLDIWNCINEIDVLQARYC